MYSSYQKNSNFSTLFSNVFNHFINFYPFMPLNFLKFIPSFVLAIASKESIIFSDLASLLAPTLNINHSSAKKRIYRFLANSNYDFDFFYSKFISYITSSYKVKHDDKRIHVAFDHMFIEHKFTIIMFTLKIGKQSIPLWFKSFDYHDANAFSFDTFKHGIDFCFNLFKSIDNDYNIIFLADRFWGNHFKLMNYIDEIGATYCIRAKKDLIAFVDDNKEKHIVKKNLASLDAYKYHSKSYCDITLTYKRYHTNLVISKSVYHKEPFYILTNGATSRAIKDYGYRFGAIEFCFKSQKTNGFFLEESQIDDLFSFNSLYTCVCIAQVLLTIIGIDYAKNYKCYDYKIDNYYISNGKRRKNYSFIHIGLILISAYIFGNFKFKLFKRLTLYDV